MGFREEEEESRAKGLNESCKDRGGKSLMKRQREREKEAG